MIKKKKGSKKKKKKNEANQLDASILKILQSTIIGMMDPSNKQRGSNFDAPCTYLGENLVLRVK